MPTGPSGNFCASCVRAAPHVLSLSCPAQFVSCVLQSCRSFQKLGARQQRWHRPQYHRTPSMIATWTSFRAPRAFDATKLMDTGTSATAIDSRRFLHHRHHRMSMRWCVKCLAFYFLCAHPCDVCAHACSRFKFLLLTPLLRQIRRLLALASASLHRMARYCRSIEGWMAMRVL